MRLGIFINTPSQFHFYKNIIKNLEDRGNETFIVARNYGETVNLLNESKMPYFLYSRPPASKLGKMSSFPADVLRAYKHLKANKVDHVTGFGIYNTFAACLLKVPDIIFNDTEPMINTMSYSLQVRLFMQLTNVLITPASFRQDLGEKQIRISGYKEMAYLHPNYYKPKDDVLRLLGVCKSEDYVLLRFNAFDSLHDLGISGFTKKQKVSLVKELEEYARVFISAESEVPEEIRDNILNTPKGRIHDVIYYSKMLVTDTSTISTEAAILGTPAIRSNKFVGEKDAGNYIELEKKYGLLFNFKDANAAVKKAIEMVKDRDIKADWKKKRNALLKNSIDVSSFMTWFIEGYPDSMAQMRKDPGIQYRFM